MNICELLENTNDPQNEEPAPESTETSELKSESDSSSNQEPEMFALFSDLEASNQNKQETQSDNSDTNNYNAIYTENTNQSNSQDTNSLSYILSTSIFSNQSNNQQQDNKDSNSYSNVLSNIENNSIDFGNSMLSTGNEDEFNFDRLGPYEKLCSLCDNPTPSNMESASKFIVPALEFCASQEDYQRVFSYLRKFCFFPDILLRSLWLEQIQNVIQYVHQEGENIPIDFKDFNMSYELALLISNLMQEPTYQVKKYATASLLCIIERRLLDNEQIEKIIIPSLLNLVKENNEDFHIDCVSLFGKLAPLIGRELTTKYFLEPFCRLCSSPVFHTRKACASNITEMANIVMKDQVEKYLLPHFCDFMKDQVWAIRKVCADMFSLFASKCSRRTRELILTEHFIRLLDDTSRWVKISAYKSLGSFIATFSKDSNNDESYVEEPDQEEEENNQQQNEESNKIVDVTDVTVIDQNNEQLPNKLSDLLLSSTEIKTETNTTTTSTETNKQDGEYSNFMYWRNSLPQVEDNVTKSNESKPITDTKTETETNQTEKDQSKNSNYVGSLYASTNSLPLYSNIGNQKYNSKPTDINLLSEELKQDIVPPILLSYFITMVEVNTQNSLDTEMNYNCAYNFPAIVLTLGLVNWHYVQSLYKKLANDNNWKVRQTLAYSIHEIAIILGTQLTQSELVPVFDSFIKDVDEVRMGIVANLSKFLKVLSLDYRKSYMPKLNDFLKMDNQRNWRFRNELGLQIADFCDLFPTDCIAEYIQPVTFILALDKVAEVRTTAVKALTIILKQFEHNTDDTYNKNYRRNFIDDVIRTFANNNKWSFRQLYVVLCDLILKEKAYSDLNGFCVDFLPKLFSFRNDKVPNIRVLLAKVIANHILNSDFFNENTQIANELEITLQYLSGDQDEDVQSYVKKPSSNSEDKTELQTGQSSQEDAMNNDSFTSY